MDLDPPAFEREIEAPPLVAAEDGTAFSQTVLCVRQHYPPPNRLLLPSPAEDRWIALRLPLRLSSSFPSVGSIVRLQVWGVGPRRRWQGRLSPPGSNPGRFPFRTRNESGSTSFYLGHETERAWTKRGWRRRRNRTCGEGAGGGRARGGGTRTHAMEARTNGGSAGEEVRTLFISGLPSDVKEREIYLLFRSVPGYEGCRLSLLGRDQTPVAFAVFDTQATCMDVIQDLNGIRMDPASSITLRIELAKSNSRPKKYRPEGENAKPTSNGGGLESRGNSSGNLQGITFGAVGESSTSLWSGGLPGLGWSGITETGDTYDTIGLAAQTQAQQNLSIFANPTPNPVVSAATGGRTPIPTLFVGNLNPNCTEAELREVFNLCPGFRDIHMQFKTHAPVAFVDFENVECSTQALNSLQGLQLKSGPGSEPGVGMRIEFARSRTRT